MTNDQFLKKQRQNLRLLRNIKDYSRAVNSLSWQRQGIFAAIAILTGWFFVPWKAALFFAVCMACEYVDLLVAKKAADISEKNAEQSKNAYVGFLLNTVVSASAISLYAVWVGVTKDGAGMFTALFCLFAAALYASLNNHQIFSLLVIRFLVYGASFLTITIHDLWVYRPPLSSDMWLQFFTIIFVMYFLIDCSVGFVRMYQQDLKRIEELEAEHERTKAALVLKSQFISVVSHELRTPLTSIKGALDLVNSGKVGDLPPQAQKLLDLAGRNSQRLATLVNDLLDVQKIEEGKMAFKCEVIDIMGFVSDAVLAHESLSEKYSVRFILVLNETKEVWVNTDPSRLMQVFANVISNAAKFSPNNGDISISVVVETELAKICIRDQGVGIPPGSKEKVFGRFTQIDSTDQRKFGGTGLGMNISKEIMIAIGGDIDYESEPGRGTTFTIAVPRARDELVEDLHRKPDDQAA